MGNGFWRARSKEVTGGLQKRLRSEIREMKNKVASMAADRMEKGPLARLVRV